MLQLHVANDVFKQNVRCAECARLWMDPGERWTVYVSDGVSPGRPVAYCLTCAVNADARIADSHVYWPPTIRDIARLPFSS